MVFIFAAGIYMQVAARPLSKALEEVAEHLDRRIPYHFAFKFCFPTEINTAAEINQYSRIALIHGECKAVSFNTLDIS